MTQEEFEEKIRQLAERLEESERTCAQLAQYVQGCKDILRRHGAIHCDYRLGSVLNEYWRLKTKYEPCEVDDFGRPIPPVIASVDLRCVYEDLPDADDWNFSKFAVELVLPGAVADFFRERWGEDWLVWWEKTKEYLRKHCCQPNHF